MATKKSGKKATKKTTKMTTKKVAKAAVREPSKIAKRTDRKSKPLQTSRARPIPTMSEDELDKLIALARAKKASISKRAMKSLDHVAKNDANESSPNQQIWDVVVGGSAQVRARYQVEASSEDEAWEKAREHLYSARFRQDELEFYEIRLDDEVSSIWQK